MWPFDYFKKRAKKEEQERQRKFEQERIARERERRLEESRRKERERQERQKDEREKAESMQPFTFKSDCHQRYENSNPVKGLQKCLRTVSVVKNTNGCRGYKLAPGIGYIVKIYNDDLGKPNMSDKPMKIVSKSANMVELRGFPIEAQSPFGWQEVDYSDYGFVVYYKNGAVEKCVLYMYDRDIRLEYMKLATSAKEQSISEKKSHNRDISINAIANGIAFDLRLSNVRVMKQPYHGNAEDITIDASAYARITRKDSSGVVVFDISNIAELRSKGILQQNPSFTPHFTYQRQGNDYEAASAEVNNSWAAATSGKEYISLFQIRRSGHLVG